MIAMFRSLGHKNYRRFTISHVCATSAGWMQNIALAWLVFKLTGTGAGIGMIIFLMQFPALFTSLWGGLLADRISRRRLMVVAQSVYLACSLVLALLSAMENVAMWHLTIVAVCIGLNAGLDMPARHAVQMDLVPRADLPNAIALNASIFNVARIVGPTIAGFLVAEVGIVWCFLINACCFAAAVLFLLSLRLPEHVARVSAPPLKALAEGLQYCGRTPYILAFLLCIAGSSLFASPMLFHLPLFTENIFNLGPKGYGFFMAVAGMGALAGALWLAARENTKDFGRWVALSCMVLGVSVILFSISTSLPLSVLLLPVFGVGFIIGFSGCNTLLQTLSPDEMRGRVMAVFSIAFMSVTPLGCLFTGFLADKAGVALTFGGCGLVMFGIGCVLLAMLPRLRAHVATIRGTEPAL